LRGYLSEAGGNPGQLQILSLRGNHLSGIISPSLANCSQLRALYLYQNDFSGPIPTEIVTGSGAPQQPEVLHPASNSLTGSIPVQIGNLKRLRILDVSRESRHRYHSTRCGKSFSSHNPSTPTKLPHRRVAIRAKRPVESSRLNVELDISSPAQFHQTSAIAVSFRP